MQNAIAKRVKNSLDALLHTRIDKNVYMIAMYVNLSVISIVCAAFQSPGQLSYDSVTELQEASTGTSLSWFSSYTSALLSWLGGGIQATTLFVVLNVLLTYGSFAIVMYAANAALNKRGITKINFIVCAITFLIVLNPILFIFSGIVWKDVLFAAGATFVVSLCLLAALMENNTRRYAVCTLALLLSSSVLFTRQQGYIVAPVLVYLVAMVLIKSQNSPSLKLKSICITYSVFLIFIFAQRMLVTNTILHAGKNSEAVGITDIFMYDISGIIYLSKPNNHAEFTKIGVPESIQADIRKNYSKYRVDYLFDDSFTKWTYSMSFRERFDIWKHLIIKYPNKYMLHRLNVFLSNLGVFNLQMCQPIQVGVIGNPVYLSNLGIRQGVSRRAQIIYDNATPFFNTIIYRHWLYLISLISALFYSFIKNINPCWVKLIRVSCLLGIAFDLAFLPTSIGCSFRYLYLSVPLTSLILFALFISNTYNAKKDV